MAETKRVFARKSRAEPRTRGAPRSSERDSKAGSALGKVVVGLAGGAVALSAVAGLASSLISTSAPAPPHRLFSRFPWLEEGRHHLNLFRRPRRQCLKCQLPRRRRVSPLWEFKAPIFLRGQRARHPQTLCPNRLAVPNRPPLLVRGTRFRIIPVLPRCRDRSWGRSLARVCKQIRTLTLTLTPTQTPMRGQIQRLRKGGSLRRKRKAPNRLRKAVRLRAITDPRLELVIVIMEIPFW